ncbi:hypothetical protein JAAARDRAFT_124886 [Jaapia argillacea MUCL 33604]|uniref:Uncharacterized protein n=1 Tax=Jaapia argillacea MUCL 33604 TaxID=933084 RepID=A0A067QED9_9AGAM|nr:hypothetical protein JAAARDRAFT_124886 [Jaapia argillacea MUCL 33604]
MPGSHRSSHSEDEDEGYSSLAFGPNSQFDGSSVGNQHRHHHQRQRPPKRRTVFEGLALEEEWKKARGWLRKMLFIDMGLLVLWGGIFVWVLIGPRCPSGGFEGWCDSFNVGTAAACLMSLAFGFSVFFDVKDLHASRQSPRTRT